MSNRETHDADQSLQTVLLVDDEQDIRTIGTICLKDVGNWNVLVAATGYEAQTLAAAHRPDVILLDVMMPELDGLRTLEGLRREPATRDIPVIFMTARVQRHEVEAYQRLGAAGVVEKPFDPLALPDLIRDILRRYRVNASRRA